MSLAVAALAGGETVIEDADSIATSFPGFARTLAALRDTLLPKLISGELRVRDAEQKVENA
jgi:type I restriction enzyme S subunit